MAKRAKKIVSKNGREPTKEDRSATSSYFLSVSLRNVRCFGDKTQTLNLANKAGGPAQWTLLLGDNGAGKTTILQALASATIASPDFSGWALKTEQARQKSLGHLLVEPGKFLRGDGHAKAEIEFCFAVADNLCSTLAQTPIGEWGITQYKIDWGVITQSCQHKSAPSCFGYGASRRLGDGAITSGWQDGTVDSVFDPNAPLRNAEEWLATLDWASSQESPVKKKQRHRLDQVKKLLVDLLPDVEKIRLSPPKKENDRPRFEFQTPYGWVTLRQLSYGYQTLTAWMVDLASRMVERYPDSPDPLSEPAVVLVDEIDLHLHPKWQRDVMARLSKRFPNTQFIVTAHSPLIVQAAASVDANIAVLRRDGDHVVIDDSVESVRGWRIDQILTSDLYELPSARAKENDKRNRSHPGCFFLKTDLDTERVFGDDMHYVVRQATFAHDSAGARSRDDSGRSRFRGVAAGPD